MAKEVDRHLGVIRQKLRKPLEAEFARGNLTAPQRIVMQALVQSQGLSLKQLSEQVSLAHSTVSGIVDRLQSQGMVRRHRDENDGRATVIVASRQVREFLANRMPAIAMNPLTEALRAASPADRAAILRGLRKLRQLIERSHSTD